MKAKTLLLAAGALAGLASLSFAGPGPDYWARMNAGNKKASYPSIRQTQTTAGTTAEATPAAKPASSCANCECCANKI